MNAPVITIFVRHTPSCKYAGDEFGKRCNCRKHLRWTMPDEVWTDKKGKTHKGKQYRKKANTRSWAGAEEYKRRLEDQLAGRAPRTPDAQQRTIRDAYDAFLKSKKVKEISDGAYKKYELEISRFVTFCERRGVFVLESIDILLLTDYKATWPERYPSTATRQLVQQCLRVFLNYCHGAGWLTRVPKLDAVKVTAPPTLPLTDAEYKRVLAAVPEEFKNGTAGRVRSIIQLMRWSGLAVRDASCLRSDALTHSTKGVYRVTTDRQKTGVHVSVPIPPDVAADILAGANKGADYLFYVPANGSKLSFTQEHSRKISAAFTRAGIVSEGNMVSHRLRDSFAVHLLSKGVPMEEVSKLLGHKSIATTERHYAPWASGRQSRVDSLVSATWSKRS